MSAERFFAPGEPLRSFLIPELRNRAAENRRRIAEGRPWPPAPPGEGGEPLPPFERLGIIARFVTPDGRAEYQEFCVDVDRLLTRLGMNLNPADAPLDDGGVTLGSLSGCDEEGRTFFPE